MKNKFIKFFALISAIIISISCGEITKPKEREGADPMY